MLIKKCDFESLIGAYCSNTHSILGMHRLPDPSGKEKGELVVRAYLPNAEECSVAKLNKSRSNKKEVLFPLERIGNSDVFEGVLDGQKEFFTYQLKVAYNNGTIHQFYDPYSFLPTISEESLYLFNEGKDRFIHNKLGANFITVDGISGISFSVWAPAAKRVSVVGDFNFWDGRSHMMRGLGSSGIWEIFIPGLTEGVKYKFEILGEAGVPFLKTDPYGKYFESPPHNASIVYDTYNYKWNDQKWLKKRESVNWKNAPCSIYEMHLGSWKRKIEDANRPLSYREIADELVPYLKDMKFTHVEFMPLAEHPFDGSWGYQVTGFFAPTQRFGSPEDFKYLVDQLHQNDIGVIMDWVPAHFPEDRFALARFDETALYEHEDPRQGKHQDWGTLIFNYERCEVKSFLISNALAWFEHFHIDGLRVDAVASMLYLDYSRKEGEWVPNKYGGRENVDAIYFLREVNDAVHKYYPGALMIAEESTSFDGVSKDTESGGLGFDFKWNMGWMHDILHYMQKDPIYRKYEHHHLTFGMLYQYSESFVQVFSHDEVVHGKCSMLSKMPGDSISAKANQLRALYGLMWLWPGKKTLFMGSEFGQSAEWNYAQSLDWHLLEYPDHQGIQSVVRDLNDLYINTPGLANGDIDSRCFEWIACADSESGVIAFIRWGETENDSLVVVAHFTPIYRENYRVGVPLGGYYKEILNTDAHEYGGFGFGNSGGVDSESVPWDSRENSISINLPPNSLTVFRYTKK